MSDLQVHFSSKSNEWQTPPELFKKLDDEFHFQLDAAATKENALCENFFTQEQDSLKQDWASYGRIFVNPPYGRVISQFVEKAYLESRKGCVVVMLIPARTDTKFFYDYCMKAAEIRFIKGRVKFKNPNVVKSFSAPFPSMIVVFDGSDNNGPRIVSY